MSKILVVIVAVFVLYFGFSGPIIEEIQGQPTGEPYLLVLGVAQDGGVPQAGTRIHRGWDEAACKKHASCLAIVDPAAKKRWMIDCTPDFREQLHMLDVIEPVESKPGLDGIFISHAHIGHYTGLMHLGLEVMGACEVPVYAMPRMSSFLAQNGPWSQLINYKNIVLHELHDGLGVRLTTNLIVTPLLVPHRQEYSEVIGFVIQGPRRTVLYISDIDSWEEWEEMGMHIEDIVREVDVAYVDGTFYADGEIPGRDMSSFPHPLITHTMNKLGALSANQRSKVRFIHLNHTNPAVLADSEARRIIEKNHFRVAKESERIDL
ncbi:MAG: MBL fold metallo-hydrolase [Candidatus Latescibacterota bacterium]